jgi:hypothetical protein
VPRVVVAAVVVAALPGVVVVMVLGLGTVRGRGRSCARAVVLGVVAAARVIGTGVLGRDGARRGARSAAVLMDAAVVAGLGAVRGLRARDGRGRALGGGGGVGDGDVAGTVGPGVHRLAGERRAAIGRVRQVERADGLDGAGHPVLERTGEYPSSPRTGDAGDGDAEARGGLDDRRGGGDLGREDGETVQKDHGKPPGDRCRPP